MPIEFSKNWDDKKKCYEYKLKKTENDKTGFLIFNDRDGDGLDANDGITGQNTSVFTEDEIKQKILPQYRNASQGLTTTVDGKEVNLPEAEYTETDGKITLKEGKEFNLGTFVKALYSSSSNKTNTPNNTNNTSPTNWTQYQFMNNSNTNYSIYPGAFSNDNSSYTGMTMPRYTVDPYQVSEFHNNWSGIFSNIMRMGSMGSPEMMSLAMQQAAYAMDLDAQRLFLNPYTYNSQNTYSDPRTEFKGTDNTHTATTDNKDKTGGYVGDTEHPDNTNASNETKDAGNKSNSEVTKATDDTGKVKKRDKSIPKGATNIVEKTENGVTQITGTDKDGHFFKITKFNNGATQTFTDIDNDKSTGFYTQGWDRIETVVPDGSREVQTYKDGKTIIEKYDENGKLITPNEHADTKPINKGINSNGEITVDQPLDGKDPNITKITDTYKGQAWVTRITRYKDGSYLKEFPGDSTYAKPGDIKVKCFKDGKAQVSYKQKRLDNAYLPSITEEYIDFKDNSTTEPGKWTGEKVKTTITPPAAEKKEPFLVRISTDHKPYVIYDEKHTLKVEAEKKKEELEKKKEELEKIQNKLDKLNK